MYIAMATKLLVLDKCYFKITISDVTIANIFFLTSVDFPIFIYHLGFLIQKYLATV